MRVTVAAQDLLAALLAVSMGGCGAVDVSERRSQSDDAASGIITTVAGTGEKASDAVDADADGRVDAPIPAIAAHLDSPLDVAAWEGRLLVLDSNGHKVRGIEPNGEASFIVGTGTPGDGCASPLSNGSCPAVATQLDLPASLVVGSESDVFIAGWHDGKVRRFRPVEEVVETFCGGHADGEMRRSCYEARTGRAVALALPSGVALDRGGNLFVSDQGNQIVRRVGVDGSTTTVVGTCAEPSKNGCPTGRGYEGDGGPAVSAKLRSSLVHSDGPQGRITFDRHGNLYIADSGNHVVRRVTPGNDGLIGVGEPAEERIETIAGNGRAGFAGDGGLAVDAMLSSPTDVAVASDKTIYIADRENSCIRRVQRDGVIDTVAGKCGEPGFGGDGDTAVEARLNRPAGIDLGPLNTLLVADTLNHRVRQVRLSE